MLMKNFFKRGNPIDMDQQAIKTYCRNGRPSDPCCPTRTSRLGNRL